MNSESLSKILGEDFRLLTAKELASMLDMSVRTIWRLRKDGSMPQPVRVGRALRWRLLEIRQWIAQAS